MMIAALHDPRPLGPSTRPADLCAPTQTYLPSGRLGQSSWVKPSSHGFCRYETPLPKTKW
uniref:Uncharacterized protein n=1 Tax=Parascaris equorum TaxID=6256 RepID=A0A914RMC5_PAREQ